MFYKEVPPCQSCGRIFVPKNNARVCSACRGSMRKSRRARSYPKRERPILCDCGSPAVVIIEANVGEDGCYCGYMPLCEACRQLEQALCRRDLD